MNQHTPTPWIQYLDKTKPIIRIDGADGMNVASVFVHPSLTGDLDEENAEFLVHAANCHDELCTAVAALLVLSDPRDDTELANHKAAEASLAKAIGGSL